jgi:hypothetical protein
MESQRPLRCSACDFRSQCEFRLIETLPWRFSWCCARTSARDSIWSFQPYRWYHTARSQRRGRPGMGHCGTSRYFLCGCGVFRLQPSPCCCCRRRDILNRDVRYVRASLPAVRRKPVPFARTSRHKRPLGPILHNLPRERRAPHATQLLLLRIHQ